MREGERRVRGKSANDTYRYYEHIGLGRGENETSSKHVHTGVCSRLLTCIRHLIF